MDEEDSLQPSNGMGTGNAENCGRSPAMGADYDESWDMLVAQRRGTTMAVTQPQDHDHTQGDQLAYTTQQMPTTEPMGQLRTQQEKFLGIGTALKRQGHLNYKQPWWHQNYHCNKIFKATPQNKPRSRTSQQIICR
jgi:hypothetical protein